LQQRRWVKGVKILGEIDRGASSRPWGLNRRFCLLSDWNKRKIDSNKQAAGAEFRQRRVEGARMPQEGRGW
jgi:hypothetical protein